MYGKTFLASTICGLFALVQPMSLAAAAPSLAGSWQITLTPVTPPIPTAPISGLATFTSDGSTIETDTSEVVPGPASTGTVTYGTPGHGIWQVSPALISLIVQYISLLVSPDGSLFAKNITSMLVTMNSTGNQFTGTFTTTQAAVSGVSKTMSGTVKGQLIPHPALP